MQVSERGLKLIAEFEGFSPFLYNDPDLCYNVNQWCNHGTEARPSFETGQVVSSNCDVGDSAVALVQSNSLKSILGESQTAPGIAIAGHVTTSAVRNGCEPTKNSGLIMTDFDIAEYREEPTPAWSLIKMGNVRSALRNVACSLITIIRLERFVLRSVTVATPSSVPSKQIFQQRLWST